MEVSSKNASLTLRGCRTPWSTYHPSHWFINCDGLVGIAEQPRLGEVEAVGKIRAILYYEGVAACNAFGHVDVAVGVEVLVVGADVDVMPLSLWSRQLLLFAEQSLKPAMAE